MSISCLRIHGAMTAAERQLFLDNFTAVNRRYRGAAVADILDELDQTDAHIGFIEEMFDSCEFEIEDKELVASAIRACVWLYGEENVTWSEVTKLVLAAKP